jgi:hypothetical protein
MPARTISDPRLWRLRRFRHGRHSYGLFYPLALEYTPDCGGAFHINTRVTVCAENKVPYRICGRNRKDYSLLKTRCRSRISWAGYRISWF